MTTLTPVAKSLSKIAAGEIISLESRLATVKGEVLKGNTQNLGSEINRIRSVAQKLENRFTGIEISSCSISNN
jgi:hypothetical protein